MCVCVCGVGGGNQSISFFKNNLGIKNTDKSLTNTLKAKENISEDREMRVRKKKGRNS